MKKVLIIAYNFHPTNKMGAVRPTKLAKYLPSNEISIDVLTASESNNNDSLGVENINKIYRLPNNKAKDKVKAEQSNSNRSSIIKEYSGLRKIQHKIRGFGSVFNQQLLIQLRFTIQFLGFFRKNKSLFNQYDVIITTYGPLSPILMGLYLSYTIKAKWIVDFRDPMENFEFPYLLRKLNKLLERVSCRRADKIVTVSEGYLDKIVPKKYLFKSQVITNGYDTDDFKQIIEKQKKTENKIKFVYTGSLYSGKRDVKILFKVIRELIDENKIIGEQIEFHYAGKEFSYFYRDASTSGFKDNLINHGFISRGDALQLQLEADFLILLSWNNANYQGVIPGKFLEYLPYNIPILSIISGDTVNSEVKNISDKLRIGISIEEANLEYDYTKFKEYILNHIQTGGMGYQVDTLAVREYSYKFIAAKYTKIINIL